LARARSGETDSGFSCAVAERGAASCINSRAMHGRKGVAGVRFLFNIKSS
jgi:hypothetical protein